MNSSLDQALAALPHGPAFRFVDEVTALEPGKSAQGRYLIKGSENFLEAHFPGEPMMPGVLMIEAIAQVAGIAAQSGGPDSPSRTNLRLAAVNQAKILGPARPGDQLLIQASIVATMGGLIQAEGQITILAKGKAEGPPIVTARITLSVAK